MADDPLLKEGARERRSPRSKNGAVEVGIDDLSIHKDNIIENLASTDEQHRLGCLQEDPALEDADREYRPNAQSKEHILADSPPSSVDNRDGLPPVGNQGTQGSCVGWAVGYYCFSHQMWLEDSSRNVSLPKYQYSPAFIYNHINSGWDLGSMISDAMRHLWTFGCATMADMPYNQNDWKQWPLPNVYINASRSQLISYQWIGLENATRLDVLKAYLADGNVAVTSIEVYEDFFDFDSLDNVYSLQNAMNESLGGHAVCIVGYDDDKATPDGNGAFLMVNSWGAGWGDAGFWWMSYEATMNTTIGRGYAYTMNAVNPDHDPQVIARTQITHERRGQIMREGLEIGLGSPESSLLSKQFFGYLVGYEYPLGIYQLHPFPGTEIAFDISCLLPGMNTTGTNRFYVEANDSALGSMGLFDSFGVTYDNWTIHRAAGHTQIQIPDMGSKHISLTLTEPSIHVTSPSDFDYISGVEEIEGTIPVYSSAIVHYDGWERTQNYVGWSTRDDDPAGGYTTWGISDYHASTGLSSAYCGGSPTEDLIYSTDFNETFNPWTTNSHEYPWSPWTLEEWDDGDHYAYCTLLDGEFLREDFVSPKIDTSAGTNIKIRFFLDFEVTSTEPCALLLKARRGDMHYFHAENISSWIANWDPSASTYQGAVYGIQTFDLPEHLYDSQTEFQFQLTGSGDSYVKVDDFSVFSVLAEYPHSMDSHLYREIDLSEYDAARMYFSFHTSCADANDYASAYYSYTVPPIQMVLPSNSSGWLRTHMAIPTSAKRIGFRFVSNGSLSSSGFFVDDVIIYGFNYMSDLEVSVDSTIVGSVSSSPSWKYSWNTSAHSQGLQEIEFTGTLRSRSYSTSLLVYVDKTPPSCSSTTEYLQYGARILLEGAFTEDYGVLNSISITGGNGSLYFQDPCNITGSSWWFTNSTTIPSGTYEVNVTVSDTSGQSDTVSVEFEVDNTPPEPVLGGVPFLCVLYEDLPNQSLGKGYFNFTLDDANPGIYEVYLDGKLLVTDTWKSYIQNRIWLNYLLKGSYELTLIAWDTCGNNLTKHCTVEVYDVIAPDIASPGNITFTKGTVGNMLEWEIYDRHPGTFIVWNNGTEWKTGSWSSNVTILLDDLPVGTHIFDIRARDEDGFRRSNRVWVFVLPEEEGGSGTPPMMMIALGGSAATAALAGLVCLFRRRNS